MEKDVSYFLKRIFYVTGISREIDIVRSVFKSSMNCIVSINVFRAAKLKETP